MTIAITGPDDILAARARGRSLASGLGFSRGDVTLLTTAVSELARHILRSGRGGEILIAAAQKDGRPGLRILARGDAGPLGSDDAQRLERIRGLADESEVTAEGGTTTVTLQKWIRQRAAPRAQRSDAAFRILVVDDDLFVLAMLEKVLAQRGYDVTAAASGEEALRQLAREDADLVILDVVMPGLSGLDVCRRLRVNERSKDVPVIFLTAKSSVEDQLQGSLAGSDLYLTKPLEPERLLALVEMFLEAPPRHSPPGPISPAPGRARGRKR